MLLWLTLITAFEAATRRPVYKATGRKGGSHDARVLLRSSYRNPLRRLGQQASQQGSAIGFYPCLQRGASQGVAAPRIRDLRTPGGLGAGEEGCGYRAPLSGDRRPPLPPACAFERTDLGHRPHQAESVGVPHVGVHRRRARASFRRARSAAIAESVL